MPQFTAILQCVECHVATVEFERGWLARLPEPDADGEEGPAQVDVVVLCPDCAERTPADYHRSR